MLNDQNCQSVIRAVQDFLEVRQQHPERTLAEYYLSGAMTPPPLKAQAALAQAVYRAVAPRRGFDSNEQRARFPFECYTEQVS